jgi:O-antigen ligase
LSISILFFLSARAAIASLFISAFVTLSLTKDRALIFRCLATTLVGSLFFLLVFKGIPALIYGLPEVPLVVNLNSSGRWALWSEGLILLKEHWLLGVGGMQYGYWSQLGFGHPHNLVLQIALEHGVPALFIVLFFVGRFLVRLARMIRKNKLSSFQIGCCWAFVATLGVAMFSGVWVAPLTQLLLVMIVAPLIGPYVSSYKAPQPVNKAIKLPLQPPIWVMKFGLLFMIMSFLVLLFNEIERHHESIDYSKIEKPLYAPRFWQESSWPKLKANDS